MNDSNSPTILDEKTENRLLHQARQIVYQFFSLALAVPQEANWKKLKNSYFQELLEGAIEFLKDLPQESSFQYAPLELSREFFQFSCTQPFLKNSQESTSNSYNRIFGLLISRECPPYETEYCPQTFSVYRSHQIADIAGYYAAFGIEPSHKIPLRADHIALECEFMAWLIAKTLYLDNEGDNKGVAICQEAQKKFVQEHLAWWVPAFASAIHRKAEGTTNDSLKNTLDSQSDYGRLSLLLASFVPLERHFLQVLPSSNMVVPKVQESSDDQEGCGECPLASDDFNNSEFTCEEENPS